MMNEMTDEVILEYDFCDIFLGKIRGLNSEEKERMRLWLRKQVDTIHRRQPLAIVNFQSHEYDILDKGVFRGYWANVDGAKKFASRLLGYVRRFEQVPIVNVRVNEPEYPPEYRIAKMKSQGYSDEDIIDKAKTLGLEETKTREIIKDYINKQARFDMKAFCSEWEKSRKSCGKKSGINLPEQN
jgi:hypothetical protein